MTDSTRWAVVIFGFVAAVVTLNLFFDGHGVGYWLAFAVAALVLGLSMSWAVRR